MSEREESSSEEADRYTREAQERLFNHPRIKNEIIHLIKILEQNYFQGWNMYMVSNMLFISNKDGLSVGKILLSVNNVLFRTEPMYKSNGLIDVHVRLGRSGTKRTLFSFDDVKEEWQVVFYFRISHDISIAEKKRYVDGFYSREEIVNFLISREGPMVEKKIR